MSTQISPHYLLSMGFRHGLNGATLSKLDCSQLMGCFFKTENREKLKDDLKSMYANKSIDDENFKTSEKSLFLIQ